MLFIVAFASRAQSTIKELNYYKSDAIVYVNIETSIALSETVIEAVKNGLTLNVGYAFKFYQNNWYEMFAFAELEKNYVISYDSISNSFLLKNPVTSNVNNFSSINLLLHRIGTLRDFPLISTAYLQDQEIQGQVRFQLNTANLPVYLKTEAFFSSAWNINSDWYQWQLN